ncbi:O-antigen ligase family protein [Pseudomonas sp. p1(2021b)]|uniref:O-antigen ligase family protein n=1 Tax=Pseudomonas sp. p1(2021b) TaxID=2874628 RepID=UPI001CC9E706|nr:O-antigen ligase family protein [Pseudomonas sp. p1(2021b)]UBM26574.1 O-antigen ligase family protein [Pseudomonas sp. p1(2021b)]
MSRTTRVIWGGWPNAMLWMLVIGIFIQISGKVWIVSGSGRNTQVYLWLLLPVFIYLLCKIFMREWPRLDFQYAPWALFLGWVALSVFWSSDAEGDVFSLAKRGAFIGFYLIAIHLLMSRNEKLLYRAVMAAVFVVFLGALASLVYQYGVLNRPLEYRAFRIYRMGIADFANYGWPVAAGIFNGSIALWALGVSLDRRTNYNVALLWLLVFAVLAVYVLMTGTRGAWFALLGGGVVSVLLQKTKRGVFGLLFCSLLLIVVTIVFWDQVVFEFEKRQLSGRSGIWEYYFKVMSGHWAFGHGLGTPFVYLWPDGKSISPHAHSLYLQQVYDSGLVSLGLMLAGLVGVFYKVWMIRDNFWVRLTFPVLVFALIAMLTDVERIFTRPGDYWTVFWLPVAILLAVPTVDHTKKN